MLQYLFFIVLSISSLDLFAEQNCFGVICPTSECPDGGPRKPYVNNCCSCDPKRLGFNSENVACGAAVCAKDLCPDGQGRSAYKGDCCSCDPNRHLIR